MLGTGGGGNPRQGRIRAETKLEEGFNLTVVDLDELPDDGLVAPMGGTGAPTIGLEKLGRGHEGKVAIEILHESRCARRGCRAAGIGGSNSVAPMLATCQLGLPAVDAGGMGRAFPETSMISIYFDGVAPSPTVMVDSQHRRFIIELQNEYLICRVAGSIVAILPDLITMVDRARGMPITTQMVCGHRSSESSRPPIPRLCRCSRSLARKPSSMTCPTRRWWNCFQSSRDPQS